MRFIKKIGENNSLGGRFIVTFGGCVILGTQLAGGIGAAIGAVVGLALFAWTLKK